jgi:hypothetical protein
MNQSLTTDKKIVTESGEIDLYNLGYKLIKEL